MNACPNAISAGLTAQNRQEQRRAIAALLTRPLLYSGSVDADVFPLVRRHAAWLREWFSRHCGWALQVDSEMARLRKTPADPHDATRPLLDSNDQPFTRRRYAVLCLALAVLERSERQTVLRRLADDIASRFSLDPHLAAAGMTFDVSLRDHRRDLIEVIRYLIGLQVLGKVDGDEQQYLSSQHDVLYNVNSAALAAVPNFRRGPSTITASDTESRLEAMLNEPYPDTDEGRNRAIRTRLFRRLLDDPVVYYDSLEERERAYLISQRPSIVQEIESATGLVQEARREGVAMVDPEDDMMDIRMPEEGTDGHITLLVAEYLANRLRKGVTTPILIDEVNRYIESLVPTHKTYWRKDAAEPGAATRRVSDALARLEKLSLIARDVTFASVLPRPALGRYAIGTIQTKTPGGSGLWEQDNP